MRYIVRDKKKGKSAFDLICLPLTEMGKTTGEASSAVSQVLDISYMKYLLDI